MTGQKVIRAGRHESVFLVAILAMPLAAHARTLYVDAAQPEAFQTLQQAVDDANDGDKIVLRPGNYTGPGNINVQINKSLTISGSDPNDPNVVRTTVIDCLQEHDNSIIIVDSDRYCTLEGLYLTGSIDTAVRIDNGRIRNCCISGNAGFKGGGIVGSGGSLSISDCVFTANESGWESAAGITYRDGSLTVSNCLFDKNTGYPQFEGNGGIFVSNADVLIKGCTLSECLNDSDAVVVLNSSENSAVVEDCIMERNERTAVRGRFSVVNRCIFRNNKSVWHAATLQGAGGNVTNCLFVGNTGPSIRWHNGTVQNCQFTGSGDTAVIIENVDLINCHIEENRRAISASDSTIRDCRIINNTAGLLAVSAVVVVNCVITGNGRSQSIANYHDLSLINCTLADNRGGGDTYFYSLPYLSDDPLLLISNCIFWNNSGEFECRGPLTIENSCMQDLDASYLAPELGNTTADPCFAVPGYWDVNNTPDDANDDFYVQGDYHLKSEIGRWDPNLKQWVCDAVTSPCIDRGSLLSAGDAESWPHGSFANLGAYGRTCEASLSTSNVGLPGDFDCDGRLAANDLQALARDWLMANVPSLPDLDRDALVNSADFARFALDWPARLPDRPSDPFPKDNGIIADEEVTLSWTHDPAATSQIIHFGCEYPPPAVATQSQSTFNAGPLVADTTYFWRVDRTNEYGKTIGSVWQFTAIYDPVYATNPSPADQGSGPMNVILSWDSEERVISHAVYFGTSDPPEFKQNQTETTYDPGPLELGVRYYWRIDEITEYGTTQGPTWTFQIGR